jgi:Protein of unknown function (DUF3435)
MISIIAHEKGLLLGRRQKNPMLIEDVAEFARVLLTTTEMTFDCGWLRIELILFCQLAAITGSRPQALLNLQYRHIELTLIRDPKEPEGPPRLFIHLTPEFTKKYLGKKQVYVTHFLFIAEDRFTVTLPRSQPNRSLL